MNRCCRCLYRCQLHWKRSVPLCKWAVRAFNLVEM